MFMLKLLHLEIIVFWGHKKTCPCVEEGVRN